MLQSLVSAEGMSHQEALTRQGALDQATQAGIIVDIEKPDGLDVGHAFAHNVSGTWITDRNSPSWRMACENDSYSTGFVM